MRRLLLTLLVLLTATLAGAQPYSPPAGSPAADGEWPRLIVTADNRAAIRAYIHANYSTQFQAFLTELGTGVDSVNEADPDQAKRIENTWGPINYAFPVALGVAELQALGYTFPEAYDTSAELCARSYYYLTTDTTDGTTYCTAGSPCKSQYYKMLNFDGSEYVADYSITTYTHRSPMAFMMSPVLAFDWCHADWTTGQKQTIADGFWEMYTEKWEGKNLLIDRTHLDGFTTHARWVNFADDLLFAVTAWGDTDVLDGTKRQTLFDAFYVTWFNRFVWELDDLLPEGLGSWTGVDYWYYTQLNLAMPVAAIDTALNTTISTKAHMANQGRGLAAWFHPETIGLNTAGCGVGGTLKCPPYTEPWGYNTSTLGPVDQICRAATIATGFPRFMAMVTGNTDLAADAAAGRWAFDTYVGHMFRCAADTRNAQTFTFTPWGNAVWFWFLFGAEGVTPVKPTTTLTQFGGGNTIYRKDYTADDTFVFFGAQTWLTGGHDSKDFGSFSIRKFGPLAMKAGNHRSAACFTTVETTTGWGQRSLYTNTVGIHKGASDVHLQPDGPHTFKATWAARGNSIDVADAALPPKYSNGTAYNYAQYDADPMWNLATVMQREFTYLRGATDHEYLVILDRANVADTANDPIWKMWVPVKPAIVDGSESNPRTGKWTTTGKVLSVTNAAAARGPIGSAGGTSTGGDGYAIPASHGRLFLKSLLPADATLRMLGDDGSATLMYQSGNDDGTAVPGGGACTTGHYPIYGWGRIEIRPGTVGTTNTFLTVLQFGDSNTLAAMSGATVASMTTPGWIVASLADTVQHRIVGFAEDAARGPRDRGLRYQFAQETRTAHHLLVNLAPETTYYVLAAPESRALVPFLLLAPPVVWWRVRRRRRWAVVGAALVAGALLTALSFRPVTVTTDVSRVPVAGAVAHQTDAAGVLSFETER